MRAWRLCADHLLPLSWQRSIRLIVSCASLQACTLEAPGLTWRSRCSCRAGVRARHLSMGRPSCSTCWGLRQEWMLCHMASRWGLQEAHDVYLLRHPRVSGLHCVLESQERPSLLLHPPMFATVPQAQAAHTVLKQSPPYDMHIGRLPVADVLAHMTGAAFWWHPPLSSEIAD